MKKFKVGDEVIVVKILNCDCDECKVYIGEKGKIIEIGNHHKGEYLVKIDNKDLVQNRVYFLEDEIIEYDDISYNFIKMEKLLNLYSRR